MISKLVDTVNEMCTWTFMNTKARKSFIYLRWRSSRFNIFKLIFLRLKPNFTLSLHGIWEWKWVQLVYVTWPRWPPCPYLVKTFKNLPFWDQMADDLETWYAALVTQVLLYLFKWWPWPLPILQQGPLCFCMGKRLSCRFSKKLLKHLRWKLVHRVNLLSQTMHH